MWIGKPAEPPERWAAGASTRNKKSRSLYGERNTLILHY